MAKSAVREDIARLMGDPNELEFNFEESKKKKITPYQRSKDSSDPSDQFSELVTCRIDGQLNRLIEEQVELLRPFYRTKSDFVRDAIFKWSKFLQEEYLAPGNPVEPLAQQLDMISRQANETQQRREFVGMINSLNENLWDFLKENEVIKLAEETASYVERINDISDGYWKGRAVREFAEMPVFPNILRVLRTDERYKQSTLLRVLESWQNQRTVLKN